MLAVAGTAPETEPAAGAAAGAVPLERKVRLHLTSVHNNCIRWITASAGIVN